MVLQAIELIKLIYRLIHGVQGAKQVGVYWDSQVYWQSETVPDSRREGFDPYYIVDE